MRSIGAGQTHFFQNRVFFGLSTLYAKIGPPQGLAPLVYTTAKRIGVNYTMEKQKKKKKLAKQMAQHRRATLMVPIYTYRQVAICLVISAIYWIGRK